MQNDALTTALTQLGKAYELSVHARKQSAAMQMNSLALEKAMWACLSALRRVATPDAVTPNEHVERRRDR
jgi:hypothetical protein